jgi:Tfp pilus assembly PilM family ATPase
MRPFNDLLKNMQRGPVDVVGLDVGISGVKAVRLQKRDSEVVVAAVDILPGVNLAPLMADPETTVPALELPPRIRARYGCVTLTGETSIVKLLTFPGHFDEKAAEKIVENMGIEDASKYRIAYKLVSEGHGRAESRVLTVAMPEDCARIAPQLLPGGYPVPFSIEVSGIASLTAFMRTLASRHAEDAVAAMDFGTNTSMFAIFNKGVLSLVRRFGFGSQGVLDKVREKLGVDAETAQGIITDGSFDVSQPLGEVMDPLVKQLVVSRDFVERRENCHISKIYVCGGLANSAGTIAEMKASLEMDADRWDPFEGLSIAKDALPETLAAHRWRFSAAVGACLGTFEET